MKEALSVLSGVLVVIAFIPYMRAIVKGSACPSRVTWLIWATLDTITLVGMLTKHVVNGQIVTSVTGAWIVVILSFKFGKSGWTGLDKFCLGGAVVGIGLYFYDPIFNIAASLSTIFLGSFPTFVNVWKDPASEDRLSWGIWWVSCLVALAAIPRWNIESSLQPLTFAVIESTMVFLLFIKPVLCRSDRLS